MWDAITEKRSQDLRIITKAMNKTRKPVVTKICSDISNPELLCLGKVFFQLRAAHSISGLRRFNLGMNDGMVYFYDLRLPSGEKQRVMSLRGLKGSVVGLSTFSEAAADDEMFIIAGSNSGEVRIWDPRMFEVLF